MLEKKTDIYLQIFIALTLAINILFWFSLRHVQAQWSNVPPPPDKKFAASYGLGDASFSYRLNGLMLQNLGDTGGRTTSLDEYDYNLLTKWFFLQDSLDPVSSYIPYIATFYFGSVQTAEKFRPVLEYLEEIGTRTDGKKWRWLVYGIQIVKSSMGDKEKALELAEKLASTHYTDAPRWVKQMPAFIMNEKGDKEEAYLLMLEILKTSADKMHPNELNATKAYICEQILDQNRARKEPLCEDVK